MRLIQRGFGALVLLAVLTTPLFAQDDISAVGSGIVHPAFSALAEAAGVNASVEATGSEQGFQQFCAGEAAVVNATRPMSVAEENNCDANGVTFYEFVVGYDVLAYIAYPELDFLQCLGAQDVNSILAPTAVQNTTWDMINPAGSADVEVRVFLPGPGTTTYAILEDDVPGVGFRADAQTLASGAETVDAVASTPGAFGVVRLSDISDEATVNVLEVRNNEIGQCVEPSGEAIADGAYLEGTALYSYVRADSPAADPMLNLLNDPAASSEVVNATGFTAPSEADYELIAETAAENETGRQFSRALTEYQIPPTITGTVSVAGAAGAYTLLNDAGTAFNQQYQNVTVNVDTQGEPDGLRRLCNGELDIAVTYEPLSEERLENCAAVDVDVLEIEIGKQAVVLVANEASEHLTCMTTEQIADVWGADSAELPTGWQQISDEFPEQEFILFAGATLGDDIPNIMLREAAGESVPLRQDTEQNPDPLYRAAAVANVEGSLTYMSWNEYQEVLENEQERIQLVAVDTGDGCVTPSEETIENDTYPLTRSIRLAISYNSLARQEVQSFLWFLFQDNRFGQLERLDLVNLTLRELGNIRETLQAAYDTANATAAEEPSASATEEAEAAMTEEAEAAMTEEAEAVVTEEAEAVTMTEEAEAVTMTEEAEAVTMTEEAEAVTMTEEAEAVTMTEEAETAMTEEAEAVTMTEEAETVMTEEAVEEPAPEVTEEN